MPWARAGRACTHCVRHLALPPRGGRCHYAWLLLPGRCITRSLDECVAQGASTPASPLPQRLRACRPQQTLSMLRAPRRRGTKAACSGAGQPQLDIATQAARQHQPPCSQAHGMSRHYRMRGSAVRSSRARIGVDSPVPWRARPRRPLLLLCQARQDGCTLPCTLGMGRSPKVMLAGS